MCCQGLFNSSNNLFILPLSVIFYQLYCQYSLFDIYELAGTYFLIYKSIYIGFWTISLLSFYKTLVTPPGYVNESNNDSFVMFHTLTRKAALERARVFNQTKKGELKPNDDEYDTDSDWKYDTYPFEKDEYQQELYEKCKNVLKLKVRMCKKCFTTRVPGTYHCADCHSCVYMKDHHCIWFGKCIGQFNQKFFILFIGYWTLTSLIGISIFIWYLIKPDPLSFVLLPISKMIKYSFHFLFDFVSIIFTGKLLYEQYDNVNSNLCVINFKKGEMIEMRTRTEVLEEIFGEKFSVMWFIPSSNGGYYDFYEEKKLKYD